jgi:hypothetical protein
MECDGDQFAKWVQFVWINGEKESTLLPWLSQHPVQEWVFHDPDGETGKAYGLELPAIVIIGRHHTIVGFDNAKSQDPTLLNAALEGRITTSPQSRASKRLSRAISCFWMRCRPRCRSRKISSRISRHPTRSMSCHLKLKVLATIVAPTSRLQGNDLKDAIQELYGVKDSHLSP